MFNFLTPENNLQSPHEFNPSSYQTLIHLDEETKTANLFDYWDAAQFAKSSRGHGAKKITNSVLYTFFKTIHLEADFKHLYHCKYSDFLTMKGNVRDYKLEELGFEVIGNIVTFHRYVDVDANPERHLSDGQSVDISRGNRAMNVPYTGLVTEISYHAGSYTMLVDGKKLRVHEGATITV